ncbi:MAG: ATP-binding protein [Oscillospiraceae bacterium]|nr:ATP-binding protein [Oscillospiraceae bacterium]
MKPEHLEQARSEISTRRNRAVAENDRRFEEINTLIPEIAEINRQLFQTSRNLLQIIRSGENTEERVNALRCQNQQAQIMVRKLLKSHGYPEDYLDIRYTCPKCSDTGVSGGTYCSCLTELAAKIAAAELNRNAQVNLCSFESFDISYYKGYKTESGADCCRAMEIIFEFCKEYAANFSKNSPSIMMFGSTGLGKTHLSLSIASVVLEKGFSVLYDSVINFLRKIESEHFGRDTSGNDTLALLLECDLLILDDLGTEFDTPFYQSMIYNIINTRINRSLPTIISTNMDWSGISHKYDERITSRIFATYVNQHFVGYDVRILKAQQNAARR